MSNTSATGGYLLPAAQGLFPGGQTFKQFLQQVFVGVSGLTGDLVRPKWQREPPKSPSIEANWLAFGVVGDEPDANAFSGVQPDQTNITQRHSELEVQCSFYGDGAEDIMTQVRDGFEVQQNLDALRSGNMGFIRVGKALTVPDQIDELWRNRIEMSVFFRREIQRVYPILTLVSAEGVIKSIVSGELKTLAWKSN